jgi:hypothetical protein
MFARALVALTISLTATACATTASPDVIVLPGNGKDQAAFQQDDQICRQHAVAYTGYEAVPPLPPAATAAASDPTPPAVTAAAVTDSVPGDQVAYDQCMTSRGNVIQPIRTAYALPPAGYVQPYPFGYPPTVYGGGLIAGFGFGPGFHQHFHHRGPFFHRGHFGRGGFQRGGAFRHGRGFHHGGGRH